MLHNALEASVGPRASYFDMEVHEDFWCFMRACKCAKGRNKPCFVIGVHAQVQTQSCRCRCMQTATQCVFHGLQVNLCCKCMQTATQCFFHGLQGKLRCRCMQTATQCVFHGLQVNLCCKCMQTATQCFFSWIARKVALQVQRTNASWAKGKGPGYQLLYVCVHIFIHKIWSWLVTWSYIYTYLFIYIILLICPIRRYVIYNNIYIYMYILSMYFLFMYVPSKTQRKGIPIGTFIPVFFGSHRG